MKHVLAALVLVAGLGLVSHSQNSPPALVPGLRFGPNLSQLQMGGNTILVDVNTATMATRDAVVSGVCTFLQARLEPSQPIFDATLAGCETPELYHTGMVFMVQFDAANGVNAALNLDRLGPVALRNATGAPLATGAIVAGSIHELFYDGLYFRVLL